MLIIDPVKNLTYQDFVFPSTITANTNFGPIQIAGPVSETNVPGPSVGNYLGKIAIRVAIGTPASGTPLLSGYFVSSKDTNISNATNIVGPIDGNQVKISNTTNNSSQVVGFETRNAGSYLWFICNGVTGTNASINIPLAISIIGTHVQQN
jgi:hypothetical protein